MRNLSVTSGNHSTSCGSMLWDTGNTGACCLPGNVDCCTWVQGEMQHRSPDTSDAYGDQQERQGTALRVSLLSCANGEAGLFIGNCFRAFNDNVR